jgi:peroxiredoxin
VFIVALIVRKWPAFAVALVALGITGIGASFAAAQLAGSRAPDFVLKSFSGENLRLSEYRGEVVLLSFWANWCSDCPAQLAQINTLYGSLADSGLQPLTVSMDTNQRNADELMAALEIRYPVLDDAGLEISRLYDVESLPIVVLIDREGIAREVIEGYSEGDEDQYLERVQALLME